MQAILLFVTRAVFCIRWRLIGLGPLRAPFPATIEVWLFLELLHRQETWVDIKFQKFSMFLFWYADADFGFLLFPHTTSKGNRYRWEIGYHLVILNPQRSQGNRYTWTDFESDLSHQVCRVRVRLSFLWRHGSFVYSDTLFLPWIDTLSNQATEKLFF